jgi:hypothetical protein
MEAPAEGVRPESTADVPSDSPERIVTTKASATAVESPPPSPKRGETIAASGTEAIGAEAPKRGVITEATTNEPADCPKDVPKIDVTAFIAPT